MLHAVATLTGLFLLWLLFTERLGAPVDYFVAVLAVLACAALSARLFGFTRVFLYAPHFVVMLAARAGAVVRGAFGTVRRAIAADVSLQPALVRVRSRISSELSKAAFADMISATSGALVVEADADGLLVHVLDEDRVDAERLGRLEGRILRTLEGKAGA